MKFVVFTGAGISKSAGIPTFEEIPGIKEKLSVDFKESNPKEFEEAINDDLNIPKALGVVWNMARYETKSNKIYELIMRCDSILGIDLDKEDAEEENAVDSDLDKEIQEQIYIYNR